MMEKEGMRKGRRARDGGGGAAGGTWPDLGLLDVQLGGVQRDLRDGLRNLDMRDRRRSENETEIDESQTASIWLCKHRSAEWWAGH